MGQQILNKRMKDLATKLVSKFAAPIGNSTLTLTDPGTYTPRDGSRSADTVTEDILDVSPPVPVNEKHVKDNSAVIIGDLVVWIASSSYTFERSQIDHLTLTYGTLPLFTMIAFNNLYAGEDIAATEVFLRNV